MAKYTVVHSCGHEEVVQLYGKHAERERRIEQLSKCECAACRASRYPDLEGSTKQIAWAADIRGRLVSQAREWAERAAEHPDLYVVDPRAFRQRFDAAMQGVTSAKWLIDHRAETFREAYAHAVSDEVALMDAQEVTAGFESMLEEGIRKAPEEKRELVRGQAEAFLAKLGSHGPRWFSEVASRTAEEIYRSA